MRRAQWTTLIVMAALAVCRAAGATGLLLPEDKALPPLGIQSHRVSAEVKDGVATTRVSEEFLNSTDDRLEATFIFPLPKDAALTDFAMWINGQRQSGEVVEAGQARRIYEDIVRRMRDPGLLEYLDSNLLRMRVFPIEPRSVTKVELSYTHALPFESGVYEYTFPMKTGSRASRVLGDFTVTVDVTSGQAIQSVYSPSHNVGVTRKDDHHAIAGFEEPGALLDTDFQLFYAVGDKDFGLNLLTHRRPGQDGYFALMLSPRVELPQDKVMAKDVCFVLDTSGSMNEENRIASAREAVAFCLNALDKRDRFALLTFATTVQSHTDGLTEATPENVRKAVELVGALEAQGGTDLCGAALEALGLAPAGDRPYIVVLVTDGEPTVGVTDPEEIVARVEEANSANARVFTFGIAENLNVPLLDRIAQTTRAYGDYVAPGREIEDRISSFFRKISHPVLANLKLGFGAVKVEDVYPPELPDLFRGSQIVVFGRYSGSGATAVSLTGTAGGAERTFAYDARFPDENGDNGFLPQLWARRKIGYLLDQIRLHGEDPELVAEVERLSREYGIATPYTSYLVLENDEAYREHGVLRGEAMDAVRGMSFAAARPAPAMDARTAQEAEVAKEALSNQMATLQSGAASGGGAVALSRSVRQWREAGSAAGEGAQAIRRVGDRTFVELGGVWVDTAFTGEAKTLEIAWGSNAYFAVLDALPDLRNVLALGQYVVVVVGEKALVIAEEGNEDMTAADIRAFFSK